jgi:tetratricopeptide (TPR) repeat protein
MPETNNSNIDVIKGLTYQEYTNGAQYDKTLQFHFDTSFTAERKFLKGFGKTAFYFFMFGYMYGPLILIPIIAYKDHNWYLLFGILFSYWGTYIAFSKKNGILIIPIILLCWFWFNHGFHLNDYGIFFCLSFIFGHIFCGIAIQTETEFAKLEIMKDPSLFDKLSKEEIIYFLKKNSEEKVSISSEAFMLMAQKKFENRDFENAIADFSKAIELSPHNRLAYISRGIAKGEIKDKDGALDDFQKAIELPPQNGDAYFSRGVFYYQDGNMTNAKSDLQKARDLGSKLAGEYIKDLDLI